VSFVVAASKYRTRTLFSFDFSADSDSSSLTLSKVIRRLMILSGGVKLLS
jgi:hypothetical protein